MDELHGIFTTYEMRINQENPSRQNQPSKHPRIQRRIKISSQSQIATVVMI
jgi:hypothetical protein